MACDASPERLAQALPLPNVEYLCAPAERLPAATGSVDLVTVSQALHWCGLRRAALVLPLLFGPPAQATPDSSSLRHLIFSQFRLPGMQV